MIKSLGSEGREDKVKTQCLRNCASIAKFCLYGCGSFLVYIVNVVSNRSSVWINQFNYQTQQKWKNLTWIHFQNFTAHKETKYMDNLWCSGREDLLYIETSTLSISSFNYMIVIINANGVSLFITVCFMIHVLCELQFYLFFFSFFPSTYLCINNNKMLRPQLDITGGLTCMHAHVCK